MYLKEDSSVNPSLNEEVHSKDKEPALSKTIFWPSLLSLGITCTLMMCYPDQANKVLNAILKYTTHQLGAGYLWLALFGGVFLIWIGSSRYGNIRLGKSATPEFSTMSWAGMLFCAGIGASILYVANTEWIYHYISPPFGIDPKSNEAAVWGQTYGLFHVGVSAWIIYALPSVPIAYSYWVRNKPSLRLAAMCEGVLGRHTDNWPGKLIDICYVVALFGGVGTSLGLCTPLFATGLSRIVGIEPSFTLDVVVVIFATLMFSLSLYLGLEKGLKRFSDFNVRVGLIYIFAIIIIGPTAFIVNSFSNSVGLMASNFFYMSLHTDPVAGGGFPQGWTIFYWAWWLAYAPFMGLFVAKISKGRTLRELIFGQLFYGTLGAWLIYGVFGNISLFYEMNGVVPVVEVFNAKGGSAAAIEVIANMPLPFLSLGIFLVLAFVNMSTSFDSVGYVLAAITSKNVTEDKQPARWLRVFWAMFMAFVAITMLSLGGLKPLQTSCVVLAFPLIFIVGIAVISFLKWIREDEGVLFDERGQNL